jgi:hypothetical protein
MAVVNPGIDVGILLAMLVLKKYGKGPPMDSRSSSKEWAANSRKEEKGKGKAEKEKRLALSGMQEQTTKKRESVLTIQEEMDIASTQRLAVSSMKAQKGEAKAVSERTDLL